LPAPARSAGPGSSANSLLPFAAGNFLGPLLRRRSFDTFGRKIIISGTYILSGGLLAITAWLFDQGRSSILGVTAAVSR
jgi:hypothetical protein